MLPRRSRLREITDPRTNAFVWATGIEDTFITAPWPATGRTLDEYELTGHYEQWQDDFRLMASLGVPAARYGIPWHRVNPAPGRWDWAWPDQTFERLLDLGIDPIVDLVHYGTPPWIEGAFLHPDYPSFVAEYARRVADRYRGRLYWYTPLNEPRITAWYCGKLGWWPPFRKGWRGFVEVMLGVCRGIVETCHALHEVDREIVLAHVDATDLYASDDDTLADEVHRRQEIVFLALDLVSGRITPDHSLHGWLLRNGVTQRDLDWFRARAVELDVVGLNLYPMFTNKRLVRTPRGLRVQMPYGSPEVLVERLAQMYFERYGSPVWISETAARGSFAKRRAWLDGSVEAVRRLRERGVPVFGYTWWPMFALVKWACRQGNRPAHEYLEQMGLWDLAPDASDKCTLRRVHTPLVDAYRELVRSGSEFGRAVGLNPNSLRVRVPA